MTEVGTIHTHRLAIWKDANEIPIDLLIAKARPAVIATLPQKLVHRSASRGVEEGLAGVGVVKCHLVRRRGATRFVQEFRQRPVIAGMLRVVSIEVANSIGNVAIALPSEIILNGHVARSVGLFAHDGLRANDCGGWIVRSCWHREIFGDCLTHEEG